MKDSYFLEDDGSNENEIPHECLMCGSDNIYGEALSMTALICVSMFTCCNCGWQFKVSENTR